LRWINVSQRDGDWSQDLPREIVHASTGLIEHTPQPISAICMHIGHMRVGSDRDGLLKVVENDDGVIEIKR
jgi:hypothetical protein